MKRKTAWELAPWYRQELVFAGREGEGDDGNDDGADDSQNDGDDDGDGDDADDDAESDDDADEGDDKVSKKDIVALQKALREERRLRREAEKVNKTRDREAQRSKNKEEGELKSTKADLETANKKLGTLSSGFLRLQLDNAILAEATRQKFKDPSDALALVNRADIDYEQDEDDPAEVDIDADSVKDAVKKLAQSKKHLIGTGTDDGDSTGGSFGRRRKKGETTVDDYRNRYSAL